MGPSLGTSALVGSVRAVGRGDPRPGRGRDQPGIGPGEVSPRLHGVAGVSAAVACLAHLGRQGWLPCRIGGAVCLVVSSEGTLEPRCALSGRRRPRGLIWGSRSLYESTAARRNALTVESWMPYATSHPTTPASTSQHQPELGGEDAQRHDGDENRDDQEDAAAPAVEEVPGAERRDGLRRGTSVTLAGILARMIEPTRRPSTRTSLVLAVTLATIPMAVSSGGSAAGVGAPFGSAGGGLEARDVDGPRPR